MSYVRFGTDSDVYVFASIYGGIECCMCSINNGNSETFWKRSDVITHLKNHKSKGHKIPARAIKRIKDEIKEFGEKNGIRKPRKTPSPFLNIRTGKRIPINEFWKEVES